MKPTIRTTLLHRPTNRLRVLPRSILCSPITTDHRLGSLPIHPTGTQGLQMQHQYRVPGTPFGNRTRGVKVQQHHNIDKTDCYPEHEGRGTLGAG